MHHSTPLAGSSPLTRGKRLPSRQKSGRPRLIPAHAGKTGTWHTPRLTPGAHPRSRGENAGTVVSESNPIGSSPLTRGKLRGRRARRVQWRLIPAHAGKTACVLSSGVECAAHPRSRGENSQRVNIAQPRVGSSPLTRGKRARTGERWGPPGLIPAHAGKTARRTRPSDLESAHPRSRGENASSTAQISSMIGSSPLTRGKLACCEFSIRQMRLIPAHAGKTVGSEVGEVTVGAHPRSRGENADLVADGGHFKGSSPLTRGKPVPGADHVGDARLIPAHAGKTLAAMSAAASRRAHPRSRGENPLRGSVIADTCGSSPLTRGKPSDAPFNG